MWRLVLASLTLCFFLVCPSWAAFQKDDPKEPKEKEEELLGKTRSEWLKILLKHEELKFRKAALIALEAMGPRARGVVDGVATALEGDKEAEVRRSAALCLGRMGPDAKAALNSLAAALRNDKNDAVREAAATALGGSLAELAEPHALALAQALKDSHEGTRQAAVISLKNMGPRAKAALPALLTVAADSKADRIPRLYSLQMITRLCDDKIAEPTKVLTSIITEDKDAHPTIREAAIEGLGQLGVIDSIPVLTRLLEEKNTTMRLAAVVSLGKFGSKAGSSWPSIKPLFQDADGRIRYQAIRLAGAVSKDNAKETVGELEKAAEKSSESLENRLAALQELGQLGKDAAAAEKTVTSLARNDARAVIREAAVEALKKMKGM